MKRMIILAFALIMVLAITATGYCAIQYVGPYYRGDGTLVAGCFKYVDYGDYPFNNTNLLVLNNGRLR